MAARALACLLSASAILSLGCFATLDETYYLSAHDPETSSTTYYRVSIDGDAIFSTAKFSVGFYDREAVERLFGESAIELEYHATRIEVFGQDRKRLRDLSTQLQSARSGNLEFRREHLVIANASVVGLLERYDTRLMMRPELDAKLRPALQRARASQQAAEARLVPPAPNPLTISDLVVPMARLQEARAILEAIRIAVDGRALVRFFDGGGNEIDVATKTIVVFVASDASRFTEALRELAEDQEATQHVLTAVLGPQIREARQLASRASASDLQERALSERLDAIIAALPSPASNQQLKDAIGSAAGTAAGTGQTFQNGDQIRAYLQGMEAR